jgi:hypothetical protein
MEWRHEVGGLSTWDTYYHPLLNFFFLKGSPSPEPGKSCVSLNPEKNAKWENVECVQKLGYICKKGNNTLNSFIIPSGK